MKDRISTDVRIPDYVMYTLAELHTVHGVSKVIYRLGEDGEHMIIISSRVDEFTVLGVLKKHASYEGMQNGFKFYKMDKFHVVVENDVDLTYKLPIYQQVYKSVLEGLNSRLSTFPKSDTLSMLYCNLLTKLVMAGYTCFEDIRADADELDILIEEGLHDLISYNVTLFDKLAPEQISAIESRLSFYLCKGVDCYDNCD